MKTFEFSISISVVSLENFDNLFLFDKRELDDALVSYCNGEIRVEFARDAETLNEAVISALKSMSNNENT